MVMAGYCCCGGATVADGHCGLCVRGLNVEWVVWRSIGRTGATIHNAVRATGRNAIPVDGNQYEKAKNC